MVLSKEELEECSITCSQDKHVCIYSNVGEIALGNMQSKSNKEEENRR